MSSLFMEVQQMINVSIHIVRTIFHLVNFMILNSVKQIMSVILVLTNLFLTQIKKLLRF